LAEERAALLALPQAVRLNLNATKDPAASGVTADAVWDPVTQRGFLRIVGLKPNDPRIEQYQAWIFDASRDKRYPLSAGVFDVGGNSSEVIIPLHADLPVRVAKAFAITLEAPGGVVVPALHHVVALGAAT
jgi:anti-sigma-K factor RskA